MARKIISPKNSFNAGELTPNLYSRQDSAKYANGVQTATNCFVVPYGPIHRRTGSQFIREVKTSADNTYLLKYQFSTTEYYILEFGDTYIRFYKDGGILGGPYEVTTPYADTEVADISYVQSGRKIYLAHPNHAPRVLTRNGDTDWDLSLISFSPPPTYEAGEAPATTLTPAATSGSGVTFTAGSGLFLQGDEGRQIINTASGETGVAIITSYTNTTTVVCDIIEAFTDTNPIASGDWYMDLSPIAGLTFSSLYLGSISTVTADFVGSGTSQATFRTTDVGKYIYANGGVLKITAHNSTSSVDAEVISVLDTTDETEVWTLETDTWDATRGWPGVVGLYSERLAFAATTTEPNTLWLSETNVFTGFTTGAPPPDAVK